MQVALNRLYEASWAFWQDAESPAPTMNPQNEPFCEPKVFVVH